MVIMMMIMIFMVGIIFVGRRMGGSDAGIIAEMIFLIIGGIAAFVTTAAAAVGMGDTREALFEDAIVARR